MLLQGSKRQEFNVATAEQLLFDDMIFSDRHAVQKNSEKTNRPRIRTYPTHPERLWQQAVLDEQKIFAHPLLAKERKSRGMPIAHPPISLNGCPAGRSTCVIRGTEPLWDGRKRLGANLQRGIKRLHQGVVNIHRGI